MPTQQREGEDCDRYHRVGREEGEAQVLEDREQVAGTPCDGVTQVAAGVDALLPLERVEEGSRIEERARGGEQIGS